MDLMVSELLSNLSHSVILGPFQLEKFSDSVTEIL